MMGLQGSRESFVCFGLDNYSESIDLECVFRNLYKNDEYFGSDYYNFEMFINNYYGFEEIDEA